ncbi:hypothetical protein ACWEOE_11705 [Amycolatopsis sp. NPDC004368]
MGRIVNSTYLTLDGDITNMAAWHWDCCAGYCQSGHSHEGARARRGDLRLGPRRRPHHGPPDLPRLFGFVAGIREVKARTDRDLLQYGFGDVTRLLPAHGLLDELRVWLHPVIFGAAKPDELLYRDVARANFAFNGK